METPKIHDSSKNLTLAKTFLNSTLRKLMAILNAECGSFFLFDPQKNELILDSLVNSKTIDVHGVKTRIGEGIAGKVFQIKTPVLVQDIDSDSRFRRNGFSHYHTKSFISIPLFYAGGLAGLINIADKRSGKPFSEKDLLFADTLCRYACQVVENILDSHKFQQEKDQFAKQKEELAAAASVRERFLNMTGKHPKIQKIYTMIEAIADTRATVLINGESGTGKRLVACAIHDTDKKEKGKPFVEVSCGALTETLLESELFGHAKGAFTGAIKDRTGRFELADKGTIFLDEIDAFSPALQVKLLRILQEGEFERVGDAKTIKVDVRIIAASNQSLPDLIAQGKFRSDLYYRLNIINIEIPPLRERKSDIPLLTRDLIAKHAKHLGKKVQEVSPQALELLIDYDWPGNIRELENVVERAIILSKGPVILPEDLPDFFNKPAHPKPQTDPNIYKLKDALKHPERGLILKALETNSWNRNAAAQELGINRTTLYKKMVKFDLLKNKTRLSFPAKH